MSYSKKVESLLKSKKLRVGDRVLITKSGRKTEGLLMPQTESGDADTLVLKLDNGYNVGIELDKGARVKKSMKREVR
jgi:glutamyl-tRNA(Gln) amidotransferase subunit D